MEEVSTDDAPAAIGPYSQGIIDDGRVYVSGQGPVDPATGDVVSLNVCEQTAQTLQNVEAILTEAGASGAPSATTTGPTGIHRQGTALCWPFACYTKIRPA